MIQTNLRKTTKSVHESDSTTQAIFYLLVLFKFVVSLRSLKYVYF